MGEIVASVSLALSKAATTVAAKLGASAAVQAAVGNFVLNYGVQSILVASSIAYSRAQARKLKKALSATGTGTALDQGRSQMVRDPLAPWRLIYGQVQVSGSISFFHQADATGYHYFTLTLAHHQCEELGTIKFDNEEVPLDGSGNATGTYAGYVQIRKYTGLAAGERDTVWESEISSKWTSNHLGKSVARLHVRLKWDADKFPQGLPLITCLVKGKKLYDPREGSHDPDDPSTWEYSNNAALCAADLLNNDIEHFGKGIAWSRIKESELITAANICDEDVILETTENAGSFETGVTYAIETVGTTDFTAIGASANTVGTVFTATGAGTGTGVANLTEKRYTANGTHTTDINPNDTLRDLAGAMAGSVNDTGGTWTILAGAWRTPTVTLTDDDIISAFKCTPRQSRQDSFNGVKGTYFSPENDWAPADFPPVKNDTYKSWDGGVRLWKDVNYPFTTSYATAQRLAKIDLERGRQQIIVNGDYKLKAMQVQVGDNISYTRARLGWSSKAFEVLNWGLKITQTEGGPGLAVPLTLQESASASYDWNDGEETTIDAAANTGLYDPRNVATPSNFTALSDATTTFQQEDGSTIARVKLSWTASTDPHIASGGQCVPQYKPSAGSTWYDLPPVDGALGETYVDNLEIGTDFDFRLYFRNVKGVKSATPATVDDHTVAGDTSAPDAPTGLTATAGAGFVDLDWDDNTETDLGEYAIYRHTSNSFAGASKIAEARTSRFIDAKSITAGTTYYYWITAIDRSENESDESTGANAAPTAPINGSAPSTPSAPTYSSEGTYEAGDGTVFAYIVIDTPALPSGAVAIDVLYRVNGSSSWIIADQLYTDTTARIDDLSPGVAYQFAVRGISSGGASSSVSTALSRTAPNKSGAPATPTGLAATSTLESITLDWNDNTEDDLAYYEVYRHTSNSSGSATKLANTLSSRFVDTLPSGTTTYYYWIKAVNRTGNASSFSTGASAAATGQSGGGTNTLTVNWHPSGTGGGEIGGVTKSGTQSVVTGISPGVWVDIEADAMVSGDSFLQWSGDTGQLESSPSTRVNRVLSGGNLTLTADY